MKPSVEKNYIYNLSYQVLLLITPFITSPYISRVLGAGNIGIYSYTSSIASYFTMFAALGTSMYGQREISYLQEDKEARSRKFWEITGFKVLTTAFALAVYAGFLWLYRDYEYLYILVIQGVVILDNFFDITWFYQGMQNFRSVALRNFVIKLVSITCIFLFVKDAGDLVIYVWINVLSTLLGNAVLWGKLPGLISRVPVRSVHIFAGLRTILELFVPLIATKVYNVLDKTMLGAITGDAFESGYYEQTVKIINICLALITSLSPVLLPRAAGAFVRGDREGLIRMVRKAYRFVALLSCPVCLGLVGIASSFVPWFFGPGYDRVVTLLYVYAWVLVIIPLSNMASYAVLNPTGQHNKGTLAVCCGAAVNFSLNLLLIPRMGAMGAAAATIGAESVVTAIYLYFIRDYLRVSEIFRGWIRYFLCAAAMLGIVLAAGKGLSTAGAPGPLITAAQIAAGIAVYAFLLLVVLRDELCRQLLRQVTGKLRSGRKW